MTVGRHAAAQQADDVLVHGGAGDVAGLLVRQVHGVAAGGAAGDDADLMHRVMGGAEIAGDGVAGLVIGGQALFLVSDDAALLLRAGHHLDGGFLDLRLGDGLFALAGSQQGGLVDQVLQVGAGEAGGGLGDGLEADVRAKGLVFGVDAQNLLTALDVGQAHIDRRGRRPGRCRAGGPPRRSRR